MSLPTSSTLVVLALSLLLLGQASADGKPPSKPIVTPVTKDPATSLYTIPVKNGAPLVLDLAGNLVWATCQQQGHRTIPCNSGVCRVANRASNRWRNCAVGDGGQPGSTDPNCACFAYTNNPVSTMCFGGDVTVAPLSANATDGEHPLFPVSFPSYVLCAPDGLLDSLPSGATGVAGLSREPLSLPSMVASRLKVPKQFTLCLPSDGQTGAAIFGGGPFQLMGTLPDSSNLAEELRQNPLPLIKNPKNGAYYFRVHGITVNQEPVPLAPGALDLNLHTGDGGVAFSTVTQYTTLRSDIFNALITAFEKVTSGKPRRKPISPYNLCFDPSAFGTTRLGPDVPDIELILDNGQKWALPGASTLVDVGGNMLCFAFQNMGFPGVEPADPNTPAIIFGAHQMKDNLVLFDLENSTFAFSGLLTGRQTHCGNFNFNTGSS